MAINFDEEYANAGAEGAPAQPGAAQDLVIPAASVEQLAQAIQAGDCQSIIKIITQASGQ